MKLDATLMQPSNDAIIRLYDFSTAEVRELQSAIESLAERKVDELAVHELPFIEPIGGARLILLVAAYDQSLIDGEGDRTFDCRFMPETWDNVAGLIEPFSQDARGFQWLAGGPESSGLVLSVDGRW